MDILVVEDEKQIAKVIETGLTNNGFQVDVSHLGAEGLEMAASGKYEALVLDIMLPDMDGITVLRKLREQGSSLPVILLTARNELEDRVEGLERGADDYLTKPFYVDELVARVKALLRRQGQTGSLVLTAVGLTLNRSSREVFHGNQKLVLTSREYGLLELLMRTPGHVYTRSELLEKVWDLQFDPTTNIVEVYVRKLRSKLADAGVGDVIETVRGVGYRLNTGAPA
jgi:DNA-binding response OmpR family regulator